MGDIEYICIKSLSGLFWKAGKKYKMSEREIVEIKRHLKLSNFEDWFLI